MCDVPPTEILPTHHTHLRLHFDISLSYSFLMRFASTHGVMDHTYVLADGVQGTGAHWQGQHHHAGPHGDTASQHQPTSAGADGAHTGRQPPSTDLKLDSDPECSSTASWLATSGFPKLAEVLAAAPPHANTGAQGPSRVLVFVHTHAARRLMVAGEHQVPEGGPGSGTSSTSGSPCPSRMPWVCYPQGRAW